MRKNEIKENTQEKRVTLLLISTTEHIVERQWQRDEMCEGEEREDSPCHHHEGNSQR